MILQLKALVQRWYSLVPPRTATFCPRTPGNSSDLLPAKLLQNYKSRGAQSGLKVLTSTLLPTREPGCSECDVAEHGEDRNSMGYVMDSTAHRQDRTRLHAGRGS